MSVGVTSSTTQSHHGQVPAALLVGSVVGAIALAAMQWEAETPSQIAALSCAVTGVGIAGALIVTREEGLPSALGDGKIGAWASLSFGLVFGIASLAWLFPQTGTASMIDPTSIARALQLVCLGHIAWIFGYIIGPGRLLLRSGQQIVNRLLSRTTNPDTTMLNPWPLFCVGLVGQGLRLLSGGFGYISNLTANAAFSPYSQVINLLAIMGTFSLIVAATNHFGHRRPGTGGVLLVIIAVQTTFGLVMGNKEPVAMVGVAVALSYGVARRRFPTKLLIIFVLIFALWVLPFVTTYRTIVRGESFTLSVQQSLQAVPNAALGVSTDADYGASADALAFRVRRINSMGIIVQRTPDQVPYRPVTDVVTTPLASVVPRLVWPDKPTQIGGYEFNQEYYDYPSGLFTSAPVTPPGDLYRHGGMWVLFAGMVVLGLLYRLLDGSVVPRRDYRHLFLVIGLFPLLVKFEAEVTRMPVNIVLALVAAAIGVRLATRRSNQATV